MKWTEPYNENVIVQKSASYSRDLVLKKQLPSKEPSIGAIVICFLLAAALFTALSIFTPMLFNFNVWWCIAEAVFLLLAFFGWTIGLATMFDSNKGEFKYVFEHSMSDSINLSKSINIQSKWLKYNIYQDAVNALYEELKWAHDNCANKSVINEKWIGIINNLNTECKRLEELQIKQVTENRLEVQRDFVMEMQEFTKGMAKGMPDV